MIKSFGKLVVPQKELEPQLNFLRINAVWNKNSFTLLWQTRKSLKECILPFHFFCKLWFLFDIHFTISSMVSVKIMCFFLLPNHGFVWIFILQSFQIVIFSLCHLILSPYHLVFFASVSFVVWNFVSLSVFQLVHLGACLGGTYSNSTLSLFNSNLCRKTYFSY